MASKRIYQIAKEFECDEKKIIEFLTGQGIKVANRLSAVSEDTYNLLKTTLFAPPPPPPPQPEPKPEPVAEKPAQVASTEAPTDEVPAQGKKKKKKKKKHQGDDQIDLELEAFKDQPVPFVSNNEVANAPTQAVYGAAITAGNKLIEHYVQDGKGRFAPFKAKLHKNMDVWAILQEIKIDDPDSAPICYWHAVNKLTTKAFKLMQEYGMKNRELLAEMREVTKDVGSKYVPQEIFTDEENQRFEAQQKFLFEAFGHGMGKVNDNLYELKMYAENKKRLCEHMSFLDYLKNPTESNLETKVPIPFYVLAETILHSIRSVPCHVDFYREQKARIVKSIENFYAWIDGYKKLKEQGADAAKLEKYLELEEKLFSLIQFMSFDNLVFLRKKERVPFDMALDLLNEYRDNMDDPDAERNFKYKVRGITNITYKPKEFVFLYQFAGLEPHKDYRSPEEIAAAEAKTMSNE